MATLDDRVTIATPEGIELELVLAGVGSRFAASLLDVAVQLGAIFALAVVLGPLGSNGFVIAVFLVAIVAGIASLIRRAYPSQASDATCAP